MDKLETNKALFNLVSNIRNQAHSSQLEGNVLRNKVITSTSSSLKIHLRVLRDNMGAKVTCLVHSLLQFHP